MRDVKEWIGKTDNTQPPASVKDRIVRKQGNQCALSGLPFQAGDKIEFDHRIPLWLGGENRESNLQAVLPASHKKKTRAEASVRAKIDRQRTKHMGLNKKSRGFRKPPPGYRYDWSKGRYVNANEE